MLSNARRDGRCKPACSDVGGIGTEQRKGKSGEDAARPVIPEAISSTLSSPGTMRLGRAEASMPVMPEAMSITSSSPGVLSLGEAGLEDAKMLARTF